PAAAQWAAADIFPNPPVPAKAGPNGLDRLEGILDTSPVERGLGRLRLKLPGGGTVEMTRDGFERRKDGDVTWRGGVVDDEGSRVILTVRNGFMAGRILRGLDEYRIIPGPGRSHVIERVDSSVAPLEEHIEPPVDYSYDIGPVYEPGGYSPNYGNSPDNIQLLVVYSLDALAAAGGEKQIEVRIQSMVDQLNTAFIDSGMTARVALVQTVAANYSDSGNVLVDMDWLTTRHELINFEVHAQRLYYGADLVSMVVDNGGQCSGVAYVMHKPAYDFVSYAYSVTALNCGGAGLAHEVGHNMGFEHNPEDSIRYQTSQPTATPFSFGHYVDGSFRTIMSYATPCLSGCPMAYRFSNPNLDFLGFPTGIADQRDNARTGDLTAPIVADFLDAVTGNLVNRRVAASVEDVEELVDGSVVFDSATLELGDGLAGVQAVGLRFQNLNIPVGMRIDSAYLEFEAADIGSDVTSIQIKAEASDNAAPFSATAFDVTGRPATTASVQWNPPAWGTVSEKHYSPDISAIIQEVVDRPGWLENNSMVITVGGTGLRTALAHDGNAASAPLLHVEYGSIYRPASISAPVVAYSYTCAGLTCTFTDESTDSDGIIVYWSWHFGGGVLSYEQSPTYTFPSEGTYAVS
ncbi:MAG: M12 family metallo-peptidase, partial [Alphaproteobacteria bacterium]|nr:M12 family metallo-peptidase [Alphaproteobacteria bacterium]